MNVELFREIIKRREYVEEISHGEWADGIEECCNQEISVLSEDIRGTIEFLNSECTASEYSWISEVFDAVIEETLSKELVECYKALMKKFPGEYKTYNIAEVVQICERILEWEEVDGQK